MAEQIEAVRESSTYLGLGLQLALTVVLFAGLGYLMDRWLGTSPWLLIGGMVLGLVATFVYLLRLAADLSARRKKPLQDGKPRG